VLSCFSWDDGIASYSQNCQTLEILKWLDGFRRFRTMRSSILAEECDVARIEQVGTPPAGDWPYQPGWISTTCPTCGHEAKVTVDVVRTRQGARFLCPKCRRAVRCLYRPFNAGREDWAVERYISMAQHARWLIGYLRGWVHGQVEKAVEKRAQKIVANEAPKVFWAGVGFAVLVGLALISAVYTSRQLR